MSKHNTVGQISIITVGALICLSYFSPAISAGASQTGASEMDEATMLSNYEAALARDDKTTAVRHVLEFSEKARGENDPVTVKLTHRYGFLLFEDGEYREATKILKKALERSTIAHGASGGEAFELNMNIGYSLSRWTPTLTDRIEHFDRALEVLRERGERESVAYVDALINIVVNLMDSQGLSGDVSSRIIEVMAASDLVDGVFEFEEEYYSHYGEAEKYILEAIEISRKLETQDEYLSAKVAVAQAKLNVMETVDLRAVPLGVQGGISKGKARERNNVEADRLMTAIDKLSEDMEGNQDFLTAANRSLMEIAWLDQEKSRMDDMCRNGTINSASDYHPDRLFRVEENGTVIAPTFGFGISTNIFKPLRVRGKPPTDKYGKPVKQASFVPVCINGQLMAALVNAPKVTIEDFY